MQEVKFSAIISVVYVIFIYLFINSLSGPIFSLVSVLAMLVLLIKMPNEPIYAFNLFLISGLFYYAYAGNIFFRSFDSEIVSIKLSSAFNIMGALLTGYILAFNQSRLSNIRWTKFENYFLLFVVSVVISVFFAYDFQLATKELQRFISFIIFYLLTRMVFQDKDDVIQFVGALTGALTMIFIFSLGKALATERYGTLGEFVFFLGPAALYIAYMAFKSPEKDKYSKLLFVVFLIGTALLLVSESRRILIASVLTWITIISNIQLKRSLTYIIIPFFLLAGSLGSVLETSRFEKTADNLSSIAESEETDDNALRDLSTGRNELWKAALAMYLDNFIVGVGPGNTEILMMEYGGWSNLRAHNIVLDTATQLGTIGLVIFFIIIIATQRGLNRTKKIYAYLGDQKFLYIVKGLHIAYYIVLIMSFLGGSMLFGKWGWLKFALIIAIKEIAEKELAEFEFNREAKLQELT
jgi:O-antigen ligase